MSADTNNVEMDTVYKEKYDELGNVIDSVLTVVPKIHLKTVQEDLY